MHVTGDTSFRTRYNRWIKLLVLDALFFSGFMQWLYPVVIKLADSSAYAAVIFSGYIRTIKPIAKPPDDDVGSGNQYLPVITAGEPITGRAPIMLHYQTKFSAAISAQVHIAIERI